jgi:hypothetical protein
MGFDSPWRIQNSFSRSGGTLLGGVQRLPQDLTGFESQDPPGGNLDFAAGLGVPSFPGTFLADHEIAEAGDLDLLPVFQGLLHEVENQVHDLRRFLTGEANFFINRFYEIRFGHDLPLLLSGELETFSRQIFIRTQINTDFIFAKDIKTKDVMGHG